MLIQFHFLLSLNIPLSSIIDANYQYFLNSKLDYDDYFNGFAIDEISFVIEDLL